MTTQAQFDSSDPATYAIEYVTEAIQRRAQEVRADAAHH